MSQERMAAYTINFILYVLFTLVVHLETLWLLEGSSSCEPYVHNIRLE